MSIFKFPIRSRNKIKLKKIKKKLSNNYQKGQEIFLSKKKGTNSLKLPKNILTKTSQNNPRTKSSQISNRTLVTIKIGSRIKNFQRGKDKGDNINKNLKEQFIKVPIPIINNGDKKSIIEDKKIWRKTVEAQKENGRRDKGAAHTERSNLIEMITLREAKALIGKIMAKKIIGTQVMIKEKSTEATSRYKTRR